MNEEMINQVLGMFSNLEDKKASQSVNKAINILKNHSVDEIKDAIINQNFSGISGLKDNLNFDMNKIIDSLPENKKKILVEKFNSPEVQSALKKDKNKAIELLVKSIM